MQDSSTYLFFLVITKTLTYLKGNRHLPGASKYLSIRMNRRNMSLQMATEETCVWSCSAQSNKAETCSAEMTDANDVLQKANTACFKPVILRLKPGRGTLFPSG